MNPIKVWWRRELVQVVHVQAAPGRTVCGLDIPDSARTAPGREVVCEVCKAALVEAGRPAARPAEPVVEAARVAEPVVEAARVAEPVVEAARVAEPVVEAARVADLVAEVERLQAQLRAARPKIAALEQVRDRLSAEKVELLKRAEAATARAEAAEAGLADARAEIELLRLSLADERRRVEQRDRLGAARAGRGAA